MEFAPDMFQQEKNLKLLKDLILQINKDLNLSGINLQLDIKCDAKNLINQLEGIIFSLLTKDHLKFQNFLYRVDVPENMYLEINEEELILRCHKITWLVLNREYHKIWLRNKNL